MAEINRREADAKRWSALRSLALLAFLIGFTMVVEASSLAQARLIGGGGVALLAAEETQCNLMLLGAGTCAPAAAPPLLTNLVACYSLEEASGAAAEDAFASNDLTDNGTVGSTTGKVNNTRDWSATTKYFSCADGTCPDLSLGSDTAFTWAAWVNISSFAADRWFLHKGNATAANDEYRFAVPLAQTARLTVGNGSTSATVIASTFGALSTGTAYLVIGWHDPVADEIRISVNNTPSAGDATAWSGGTQNTTSAFNLGHQVGGSLGLVGWVDEVMFWKRVLTADERSALYNSGSGMSCASMMSYVP